MAGYRNGEIAFDSPRNVFYAGQTLTGKVEFVIDQPFKLMALTVQFLGEASVGWTENETEVQNGVKRYKEVEYVGTEQYFNETQLLAGGNAPQDLLPGTHSYKFSFMIPPSCPSSFDKDEHGRVKYGANATIELRGHTYLKEVYPRFFDVVAPFDLNLGNRRVRPSSIKVNKTRYRNVAVDANAYATQRHYAGMEPIELEFEEAYSGCFCGAGPVSVKLSLPVSAYCPGQVIPVTVQADNRSSVEVDSIILQIITRRRYRSHRPISEYILPEEVLVSVKKGSIMSNSKRNYTVDLQVPDLIVPNLEACGIIDVGYFFRAIIKMTGCNDDMEDEAELCLGLIPLTATLNGPYTHPLANDLPIGPIPDIRTIQAQLDEQNRAQQSTQNSNYAVSYVEVSEQVLSSDPSKNYQIGFKIEQPGHMNSWDINLDHMKINLPSMPMNLYAPSAPPPSS